MTQFSIKGAVALVTGTNKETGIGRAIVRELLQRGAEKVYATARRPEQLSELVREFGGRVDAIPLDVTDVRAVSVLGQKYPQVNLLVNNAGVLGGSGASSDADSAQREIEVNYMGPLRVTQSFIPTFRASKKPTALVNINSIASLVNFPLGGTYSASKAAAHSLTQAQRRELSESLVVGVYPGPIETEMTRELAMDKAQPSSVAAAIADALEAGQEDVYPDPVSAQLFEGWRSDAKAVEQQMTAQARQAPSAAQ